MNANSTISLLHAGGTVDGFEARLGSWLWYAYYGGIYIGRDTAIDTNGKPVGYGYTGSPNSQNRAIQEFTLRFQRDRLGRIRATAPSTSWAVRISDAQPVVSSGRARRQLTTTRFTFDIRYTLPGSMPDF